MSVNYTDFDKIWASTSPLTPYEFSESQYKEGWNFVGATPPSRQMWDSFMKNADEKIQYLYNHESVPVGHEYFTFNPNIPQGSLPLFGGEYSRETYSALWNWVQEQTGYLKTEAEWQQLYTTNAGNVPYYSDGDGSTTFRVPSLKCWIKGANGTVSEVGSYLEAGLPNIVGSVNEVVNKEPDPTRNGAFSGSTVITNANVQYATGGSNRITLNFDASQSNSIYGNSTTVQPPSIVGMWLVKAYGVVEETGRIDEQAYIDDRYNAMKQYVDDKIDTVSTAEISMSPIGTGKVSFTKKGNVCMANFGNIQNLPTGAAYSVTEKAPVGFRPVGINVHAMSTTGDGSRQIFVEIQTNGTVRFIVYGQAITTETTFYETLVYVC